MTLTGLVLDAVPCTFKGSMPKEKGHRVYALNVRTNERHLWEQAIKGADEISGIIFAHVEKSI